MITLYHGTPFYFEYPDLSRGKYYHDFGVGFYLAENENDALSMAVKNAGGGYMYTYEVDDDGIFRDLAVLEFDGCEEDWFKFVYDCRMNGIQEQYDVIIGPTAGGSVNDLFEDYRRNQTSYEEIKNVLPHEIISTRFGIQWCFASVAALDYIHRVEVEDLDQDGYDYWN